ncbi:hypothetical protein TRFO_23371 [Tritrichomonas foetus]|uniref:Leucine Rich Repeat family protein n=1 Tax=Tritrichomonas foetus TaxID=1144522 RepID=A0A1J4K9R7_9EUKA|nr:hypothetical protein TRFO_23371 [Tritrichomonas foetus]|eukprot:OHT08167.1 hypothetical protein TRFO_23371 [Tritrichomonas foetus]
MTKVARINIQYITEAEKNIKKMKQDIIFKGAVHKVHDSKKGTAPRILILTKQFICYFKPEPNPKIDRQQYWNHIKSYNSKFPQIDLEFDDGLLRFQTIDAEVIQTKIFDILYHVLAHDELLSLNLRRFTIPKYTINGIGVMERYRSILQQEGKNSSKGVDQQLLTYLPTANKVFKLKVDDELASLIPSICLALKPFTPLESLFIPKLENATSFYKDLSEVLVLNLPFRHLALANQPDHQFVFFGDGVKLSQLEGLTFQDITVTKDTLDILQDTLLNLPKFRSLSLQNVLKPSMFDTFSNDFLNGYVKGHLQMFNLDRTPGVELSKILTDDFPVLSSLSFAECNLDIAEALNTISRAKIQNLRYLNLSGNHATTKFDRKVDVPRQLIRLDVNDVAWSDDVFPSFIKYITHRHFSKGLRLYVERANVSSSQWSAVEDELRDAEYFPLIDLGWSGNPINGKIVEFLQKNDMLTTLFVSQVFSADDQASVDALVDGLSNLSRLRNLVVRGGEGHELGQAALPLIKAVHKLKLNHFDISYNAIGDEGLKALADLVEKNQSLKELVFTGAKFQNLDSLNDLVTAAQTRSKPIAIEYPIADISHGIQELGFKGKQLDDIKIRLQEVRLPKNQPRNHKEGEKTGITAGIPMNNLRGGSFRITKKNQQKPQEGKKKGSRRAKEADAAASNVDPNDTVFSGPFEYFVSEFTDEFPLYVTDSISREFQTNFQKLKTPGEKSSSKRHSKHKHHKHKKSDIATRSITIDTSESDDPEWVEEEELPEPEEEDEPETPLQKRVRQLYDELDFKPPECRGLVERVSEPRSIYYESELKRKAELTPLVNVLVPK